MCENLVSKAFIEFLNTVSVPSNTKCCPAADQGWNIESAHSSLNGRLGKFHFLSASSATPFPTSSHRMKPNNSEPNQRNLSISDGNQVYWPRILDVPKRMVELWPYVLIFISLAGFVYLFVGAR